MEKKNLLLLLVCFLFGAGLSAQSLAEAQKLYANGQYEKAKPIFKIQAKAQSSNGNFSLWYAVCCLKTGDAKEAIKYLETAVKKRIPSGQLYLGQAYHNTYRFEEAIACYEEYIAALVKRKQPTEEAEKLLEKSKQDFRMLKGVEEVCVIDSFVVDKAKFLDTYKISIESGKVYTYNDYFKTENNQSGTVYETEIGNKIYYSEMEKNKRLDIFSKNKLGDEWSKGLPLSTTINASGNTNYPYVLTDGVTIYYASDGEGSIGGYDIFVTRYNTHTESYLTPENVGMPFNSPANDYMYAIDEYNNLGWFASDRFQPKDKVCVYVFIPNQSKQTYNYESMSPKQITGLALLHSLKDTWKDKQLVTNARQRLEAAIHLKPQEHQVSDFDFVIDDERTYHLLIDFHSPQAKMLFQKYLQKEKDFYQQQLKLDNQRQWYVNASKEEKAKAAPSILDLEKRVHKMQQELNKLAITVRNTEKQTLK